MRKFLATLAVLLFSFSCQASQVQLAVPAKVGIGKPFVINLTLPLPPDNLQLSFLNRTLTVNGHQGDNTFLLGLPFNEKLKNQRIPLTITLTHQGQNYVLQRTVLATTATYPKEELKVAPRYVQPQKGQLQRINNEKKLIKQALSTITPTQHLFLNVQRPVPSSFITSCYGKRRFFNGKPRSFHSGTDLRAADGTTVKAMADGQVILCGDHYFSGNAVYINHGCGVISAYMHLSKIHVQQGQLVTKGQPIALSGHTGRVTGPHLHWGLSVLGSWIDPAPLMTPQKLPPLTTTIYSIPLEERR